MLSAILKHFNFLITKSQNEKKIEARKKFEENLKALQESDDDEAEVDENDNSKNNDPVAELAWSCSKFEGVISSTDNQGGIINEKHYFSKNKVLNVWNVLKRGSEVSFYLYKDTVESIKLLDAGWEEDYKENLINAKEVLTANFSTDLRTVLGIVDEVSDGIITIDVGNSKHFIPEPTDNDSYIYMKGDNLKLNCVTTEDEHNWNPSIGTFGSIVSINSFEPNSKKQEVGRVTAISDDFAVFDESVVLIFASIKSSENVKLWDKFFYFAIETSVVYEGKNFNWRVVQLIRKVDGVEEDAEIEGLTKIQLIDEYFQLRQAHGDVSKYLTIFNRSNQKISIQGCEITSNSGLIKLQSPNKSYDLFPYTGAFKIFLTINPNKYGLFVEELTVDLGIFKRKCLITLQVLKSNREEKYGSSRRNKSEIIPGQKISKTTRFIDIRIPDYQVCNKFRKSIDFKKEMMLIIQEFGLSDYQFLLEPLKEQNYLAKMRYCLYLEEIAMEIYFERYKIDRAHFENKDEFLRLSIEGVNEKRPSIGMGDSIQVKDPYASKDRHQVYEGIIHKVENDSVLVKFHSDFHSNHNRRDYSVEFHFSRASFKRQQFALDQIISPRGLGIDYLFPKEEVQKKNLQLDVSLSADGKLSSNGNDYEFFNKSLNVYQKQAVVNVLRGELKFYGPYIIYGPPGTGKTRTVIECIEQISSKIPWSRIIVATPSNSAANLIVEKLIDSGRFKGGDFVRFVSYNQIERDSIPQHLKKYCATIDIGYDKGDAANVRINDGMMMNCSKSIIVNYKIYISTLSNIGLLMHIKFLRDHFTHVIIDEAGQSIETDSLIPMTFLSRNKGQVILAGDPKQLGPVLTSHVAKYCGFDKSMLERLSENENYLPKYGPNKNEFDSRFVTKLIINYRSLPSILSIYSELFYNNELKSEVNEEDSHEMKLLQSIDALLWNRSAANKKCGVFFVNVDGKNLRTPESSSWYNDEEASRAFIFACRLQKHGISLKDVGIITPYSLQVKRLRGIIDEAMPNCDLKVGSVEEFQGQERLVIILSTVRTNHKFLDMDKQFGLGFLQCSKRMNVAVSRARALLVVFGKESLLTQDDNWRFLIQYTRQMGTYVCDK